MSSAPKKFIAATETDVTQLADAILQKLNVEEVVVFADVVSDVVLAAFPGFKDRGLDDLVAYAAQGQDHYKLLLSEPEGVEILKTKLVQMLSNFRAAAEQNSVPEPVFVTNGPATETVVEQIPEEKIPEEVKSPETEIQPIIELEKAPEAPANEKIETATFIAPSANELSFGGLMVMAAVNKFAEINSSTVNVSVSERAAAHTALKAALFSLFNTFGYDDFNVTYTKVIQAFYAGKNNSFSSDRVLLGVDAIACQDTDRSAYVAVLSVLTHAADAIDDTAIWNHVNILSAFERHKGVFNQVALDNVSEFYQHILRK